MAEFAGDVVFMHEGVEDLSISCLCRGLMYMLREPAAEALSREVGVDGQRLQHRRVDRLAPLGLRPEW